MIRGMIVETTWVSADVVALFATQDAPGHGVKPFEELRIARLRRGNQRVVERAVGADRTGFMLARELACEPRHQTRSLFGIGGQHFDDVLYRHRIMIRVPTVEVGH